MHINMDKIIWTPSTQHTTYAYAGTATYIYLIKLIIIPHVPTAILEIYAVGKGTRVP